MAGIREMRKENRALKDQLNVDAYYQYKKMEQYLELSSIHGMDMEIGKKELLGMLLEAQERGEGEETLEAVNQEDFLKSVIQNSRRKTISEYVSITVFYWLLYILIVYCISWILMSASSRYTVTALDFLTTGAIGLGNALYRWIAGKVTYKSVKVQILMFGVTIAAMLLMLWPFRWLRDTVIVVLPGWIPALILVAALAGAWLWQNKAAEKELPQVS